ncbi:hypothetical protein LZ554_007915 [Drepanopeziza brunnea f. sp. 'monogermtubi']|nr:hypothetical protein LZ554_007915 [Drepanopeziza brunnea f. sp. 'monogermtubi']
MSSQPKSNDRRSSSIIHGVPMSVFNQQLLEDVGKFSGTKDRSPHHEVQSSEGRQSRRSHYRAVSLGVPTGIHDAATVARAQKVRRSMTEHQSSRRATVYIRPVGPELVSISQPSCTGLPPAWSSVHDRFIAYLATHAPLDKNGKVQRKEESRERWKIEDISRLVMDRFEELDGCIKIGMIENRLALLDQAGDNDYFKMPYGAYKYEKWGRGV